MVRNAISTLSNERTKKRMNMKKEYVKPETSLVEVEVMTMLAGSPSPTMSISDAHAKEELSNDRRGEWGNLWE